MNKPANLGRCLWPAAARSRFPAPTGSETSAMPCDHGRRLENCQRVTHAGHQAIEASENEPIDVAEDKALRRLAPKHIDLMAKNENFGLQRCAGPEQPGHEAPKQPEEVDHRTQYHPIRRYRPAHFGFAVGTGPVWTHFLPVGGSLGNGSSLLASEPPFNI